MNNNNGRRDVGTLSYALEQYSGLSAEALARQKRYFSKEIASAKKYISKNSGTKSEAEKQVLQRKKQDIKFWQTQIKAIDRIAKNREGNRMIKGFDVTIELAGKNATFSVDILASGLYRLNVTSEDESLTLDLSEGQYYSLDAALNDAGGQVRGFIGQDFGNNE